MAEKIGTAQVVEWLWQAVRIVTSCGLAFAVSKLIGLPEGYWALITAIVITQPFLDATVAAGRDRVLGTLIGAAVGFAVIEADRRGAPSLPMFWIALVPLAFLTAVWPNLRLSCVTLVIVALIPASASAFERPVDRVLEILLGTLASIVVSGVVMLVKKDRHART